MNSLDIFITRKVSEDGSFVCHLKKKLDKKFLLNIKGESGISFSGIQFVLDEKFDACCFYSKRGVQFFMKGINGEVDLLQDKFIIAFGPKTAEELKRHGVEVHLFGNGNANVLANEIIENFQGKSILFPQAVKSKHSLLSLLSDEFECIALKTYSNAIKPFEVLPTFDFLCFTSPRNVMAFLKNNELSGKIIAIGQTTATFLREKTNKDVWVAGETTEVSIAKTIVKMTLSRT